MLQLSRVPLGRSHSYILPALRKYATMVEVEALPPVLGDISKKRPPKTDTSGVNGSKRPSKRDKPVRASFNKPTQQEPATPVRMVSSTAQGKMQMKTYTPRTPGLRHLRRPVNDHLWKGKPHRPLTFPKTGHGKGGRNNTGRITMRHRGGGHKRRIRTVDFHRKAPGKHTVDRIEYDPNRSAHLALVTNAHTQEKSYIIAAEGMREGDEIYSFMSGVPQRLIREMGGTLDPGLLASQTAFRGNCMPIRMVPLGMQVYNVGSKEGGRAVFCRSAGTYATVITREESGKVVKSVTIKMQSGEIRKVAAEACATIGTVSNPMAKFAMLGKAGRSRWLGIRPTVRGLAMNAVDHPHGGGRGKSKGNVHPVSPWGVLAKGGFKTRNRRNPNKRVVQDRERNQGKRRSGNR